jgi:quercetin dioxygenase-like cupin family protein
MPGPHPASLLASLDRATTQGRTRADHAKQSRHPEGPADWFTGDVYIDAPAASSTFAAAAVHFTPARAPPGTTHPHGQTIFVIEGVGLCQREGSPLETIRPGDRVFFEPEENHWHGAAPNRLMVHIAMQQNDESGIAVTWGRHATDEEYRATPAGADRPGRRGGCPGSR